MSENNNNKNIISNEDTLDINELASLNGDISNELIEQLQNKLSQEAANFAENQSQTLNEDASLFEEIPQNKELITPEPTKVDIDKNVDDNFIKKYKAKLNKQSAEPIEESQQEDEKASITSQQNNETEILADTTNINIDLSSDIENLSNGNIVERPLLKNQTEYNDSLDLLDNNIKYSKYVIYIDPENTEFIESLTVKERKNLINKILREQDDIAITKRRLNLFQTIIKHSIIAIITIAISIPVVYYTINASLEATINNHRRSQKIFKTLYKEKGKIKNIKY